MNPADAGAADTIAAVATPPGRGGVGIVRVSGPMAPAIAEALLGRRPVPRYALFARFRDAAGGILDRGLALYFPEPASFTGEHVLELHGHGGPVVMDLLLGRVCALGARPAAPGEFSQRAFLNGKLDLAQAEAVADLIAAGTAEAARAAARSLEGALSSRVADLTERLVVLRTHVEGAIDFAEEDIEFLTESAVDRRLEDLLRTITGLEEQAHRGRLLQEGIQAAIVGRPNVGKSSLLNRLVGRETAIVSEFPGTTRDLLRESLDLAGVPLRLVDTAGLRDSTDPVEREGVRRAWDALARADHVLLVVDDRDGLAAEGRALLDRVPAGPEVTVVRNKIDLTGGVPGRVAATGAPVELRVSARTGAGIDVLRTHLRGGAGPVDGAGVFAARRRHLDALRRTRERLIEGRRQWCAHHAPELLAEDLRAAHRALGEITGAFTSDELLGRIFSTFCIGK
ncbi:tRNA modification GTPase MnmE [bacterium BMS3Bbin12]|nr:tRNA modification GTPase MnmE [bacterium BMS3Bbin12]GBE49811.1 tRNA modification GTPase MnmE [bacterium BMS3Bbin13]HDK03607.1 tRNA uridine-5-carboxymethylaminomethyl(34) synthesis GTPase MnmE [Gammaproteobacteria bacterium]